ncbi:siderophore-interacting protein [Lacisediminihabitans sp. FW035]
MYRPFEVVVAAVERLSPSFLRVAFAGDDLRDFAPEGLDQRIKLVLPNARGLSPAIEGADGWYAAWCALDGDERPPLRTYTVRRLWRRGSGVRLEVDFVLHGDGGPASRWAAAANTGDRVRIIGPDARAGGPFGSVAWNPPLDATRVLLAGDETAAPAIASILESLQPGIAAQAFIEVPTAEDALDIAAPIGVDVRWLPRDGAPVGDLLVPAVLRAMPVASAALRVPIDTADGDLWEVPGLDPHTGVATAVHFSAGTYAWLAGESRVIATLRRHLVREVGIDRASVAFMGYWRAESGES